MLIFSALIMITISTAFMVNWLNDFVSTIPIEEVDNGPHFYIRKDLKNGHIY